MFQGFDNSIPNAVIHEELVVCQNSLHTWGRANQVLFDPAKESHHILHPKRFSGDNFRLLGVTFDPQLSMKTACYEIAAIASTRLRALLRTRHFHSRASLVLQFKSQVLSGIDFATPAIYHAPRFYVGVIDRVQEEFCEAIGVSKLEALLEYNLPPLSSRRDMSGLSLIHRVVLGIAPPQFSKLLYPAHEHYLQRGWAFRISRHSKQLHDPLSNPSSRMMKRSIFSLVYPYNNLPQYVVNSSTIKSFQRHLHHALKKCAEAEPNNWETLFRNSVYTRSVRQFRAWFEP